MPNDRTGELAEQLARHNSVDTPPTAVRKRKKRKSRKVDIFVGPKGSLTNTLKKRRQFMEDLIK